MQGLYEKRLFIQMHASETHFVALARFRLNRRQTRRISIFLVPRCGAITLLSPTTNPDVPGTRCRCSRQFGLRNI